MNSFVTFLALSFGLFSITESQPLNEATFNFIPYLNEQFNPALKHHRARFRPFVTQLGSPIANLRTGRSIKEQPETTKSLPNAECVYAFESLFCAGVNQDGVEVKIECDTRENMKNTGLGDVTRYALSELRELKTGSDSVITKMYMFGQKENTTSWMNYLVKDQFKNRNILSVHSTDSSTDQGLTILDPGCWNDMVKFFKMIKTVNEITVDSQWGKISEPVKVIAYVNFM